MAGASVNRIWGLPRPIWLPLIHPGVLWSDASCLADRRRLNVVALLASTA